MPTKRLKTRFEATCTPEQLQASKQAAEASNLEHAEFIRRAIQAAIQETGLPYPDNLTRRGKYKRALHTPLDLEKIQQLIETPIPDITAKYTHDK